MFHLLPLEKKILRKLQNKQQNDVKKKYICPTCGYVEESETPIEIFTDGESIILQKHENTCIFCDSKEDLTQFRDKWICNDCKKEIEKN